MAARRGRAAHALVIGSAGALTGDGGVVGGWIDGGASAGRRSPYLAAVTLRDTQT